MVTLYSKNSELPLKVSTLSLSLIYWSFVLRFLSKANICNSIPKLFLDICAYTYVDVYWDSMSQFRILATKDIFYREVNLLFTIDML